MRLIMSKTVSIACFAMVYGIFGLRAEEWHVYSEVKNGLTGNQQLTNAFGKAQSEDTITIHKGTYNLSTEEMMFRYENEDGTVKDSAGTCLYSTVDNLTVQGDPETPRGEIVLCGLGENDASEGGLHAIMRLAGYNCTVRNITFYKGLAGTSGVVYRDGKAMNTGDGNVYRRAGGLFMAGSGIVSNCVFDSCYAFHGAGLVGAAEAVNCEFLRNNNNASNAGCAVYDTGIIRDSLFEDNSRGAVRGCSEMMSNCVFRANRHNGGVGLFYYHTGSIIDCTFSNNTTVCIYLHGANYMPREIIGCRFEDNTCGDPYARTAGIGGSVQCTTPVKKSTFVGYNQINGFQSDISDCDFVRKQKSNVSVLADCPKVYDCRFYGMTPTSGGALLEATSTSYVSVITNCSLYRCHIRQFNIRYGNVLTDVIHMENCLVEDTVVWGRSAAGGGYDASGTFRFTNGDNVEIVNCTITTNQSNDAYVNTGGGTITFRNTLFFNNLTGTTRKWGYRDFESEDEQTIRMENSIYKCSVDLPGESSSNWFGLSLTPKFLKDVYHDKVHEYPYAVHRRSPCINVGKNSLWTASDIDLAGNPRVNEVVDIGCYESQYVVPGLKVVFR